MSHKVNLVRVLTSATGNSTPITLGSAYSQLFMLPSEAGAMNGRVYTYLIVDGNDWELGKGVYTASGTTLARTTILASRIAGTLGTTKITLSGTAQVRFIESAEDMDGVRGTRAVTGTSDTLNNSDLGFVVTYSNAAAIAVSLAQASVSNLFIDGWATWVQNLGVGTVTITPATSTINGASTLVLPTNHGAMIWSDGTNYHAYFVPVTKPLLAGNNLSDVVAATALGNLNGVSYGASQTLTAAQKAQGRANIDVLKKSYIGNGAMMVSQENGTTAGTTSGYYPVDQWASGVSLSGGAVSFAQVAKRSPAGSPNRIRCTVTTAQTTIGSGFVTISHKMEGFRTADLLLGTASAKTFVVQLGVCAPAGTYTVAALDASLVNGNSGTFTIGAGEANTDVVKSVVFASGFTSGTFATDNTVGLFFQIALAAASQFNLLATNGNVFELFDVGLYEGSAAPVFQVPDYPGELALCKRYYEKSYNLGVMPGNVGFSGGSCIFTLASNTILSNGDYGALRFQTPKRAAPTVTIYGTSGGVGQVSNGTTSADLGANSGTVVGVGETGCFLRNGSGGTITTTNLEVLFQYVANARL